MPDSDEPRYVKFRASDHELPAYYKDGSAEVNYDIKAGNKSDHSSGDDWAEAVKWFADTYGFDVPPSVKAVFTKRENAAKGITPKERKPAKRNPNAKRIKELKEDIARYEKMIADFKAHGSNTDMYEAVVARKRDELQQLQDDSILYQESADLVATHNISEEGILHAAKAGGLPMASLAVAHKDNLLENFGEITLIGDKDLIDPKGANKAKVFGADIYSPRYPSVHYDYDARDLAQVRARFQSAADEIGDASFAYDMTQKPQAEGLPRTLAESAAVRFQFLRDIGAEVEPVYKNARPYSGIPLKALDGFTADMTEEEALHDAKLMRAVAEELSAKMAGKDALKSRYGELQQALADGSFSQNRDLKNIISNFAFARGGIDFQATSRLVGAETAKRQAEFDAYVAEIAESVPVTEQLRVGKTASGRDKFVPHTLENAVKMMKKNLRGGENDFYGLPNLRAKVTPQFKSVAAIKKAKGRLVSNADFQRVVDEIQAEMGKLAQTLGIKSSGTEAFLMAVIDENFDTAAKRYGAFAGEKQQQAVAAFLTKLKEMPTEYFEVKAKEITQFSDFKAAVVPESIDEAARKVLEEAGLKLYTYDAATQSRADVVRQAAAETGLLFQDARGMFDRMADTIALLKNADASTFIHEFGHFELETMSRIERDLRGMPASELSEGERQILADFQTTLDWFGVKDGDAWAAMTLDGQREHHEKFARGMEAYLFEGKAPSEALRGVFSRVARLLKRIYRTLAGLNVELSDDIREVFGRLLASDEQIAEAEYVNGMKLLLDEDGELRAMDEAARREAEDELGRRALRDMAFARNARNREIRRLKKEYKADFARAEMAARGSIMKQPVYRAWQLFTAKMTDEDRIDGNSKAEREFGRKAKVLQGKPVYTIATRTAPQGFKALREWAQDIFDKVGNQAANPEIGTVLLNERSVRDSIAHGMNPFKAEAFQAVPDVIAKGAVVHRGENPENGVRYAYISAPVVIEGKEDIVTVLVRDSGDGGRMYLHSVATKESILNASDTETTEISRETGKVNSGYIANILRSYLKYKPKTDRTALDPSSDTLMAAIAKLGGLNKDELMREWGLDAKDKIAAPVFGMPVLRRTKGRSIDAMVEVLAEAGYLPVDSHGKADVRDLEERFSDGLSGQDWYSRHYVPREERKAGEDVVNPYALNAVRLDEASLDGLPADWAQVLQERGMTAKKGGMHPDIAAGLILDENGEPVFSDGLDLVQALVEALPPQEAIEDTARLNLLAEKGEVPTQADFEEAADLAVHNGMRARLIAGELNRLKASLGSVSLLKQAARVAAKERVEQMKTRDLRPSVFTRAEAAAAKSSEKAFKAGNIEAAAAHKRNQLIQNALARETLKAREEMEKTRRYLAKFDRVAKGVDIEYREQIEALLEDVELRPISLKETDRRKSAYQFVREMEEAGIQHSIDPDYVDTISRKSWREMTVEEMRGLADTVRQLEHLGRLKNRLLSNQAKRSYQAVRDELADTLDASAKAQHRKAQERREAATGLQKAGALLRGGYWGHLKMSTIVRMFDNGRDGGAFFTHFLLPLKQAADKEAAMQAEVSQKLYEVLKPLAKHTGRLKNRIGGKTHYQGLGELTREQLFAVALNMGNAGNIQRLLDGEGWRMEDVQRALSSTLTAQEWQAVQGVWDLLESYRPQIAGLERRMTGVEPEWVEARPFKIMSADGVEVELRGGYYPAKYDREGSGAAEKNEATTDAKAQTAAAGLAAATRRTFAKQRANEVKGRPLRLSLNVAYDAFNEIIHDLTHREAIADANRLLNSHTLDTKIRQYYGADAKRQLSRAIADIAQGNSGAAQTLDGWAGRVRQNVSVAGLGFNTVSAALQLTGWIPAVTRVGFANTAKALMTYAAHPIAATRGANEMSVMMANRSRTRFRELNDVANSVNGQNGVKAFIRRYAYWLMMRMQQVTDTIVWHGAMMKALDAGRSEAEAVQLADQTVLDTQGGGQTKDLSAVERGNEVQKLFTVFYSYMNTALNMGAASIATQRGKGRLAAELMLIWVIPTALNAMMKSLLTPGDDDDDLAKKLAKEQISFTLGMFVGGRELVQLGDIATGGKFYGYNGPAGLRPIADTYKFAQQAQQGGFDKGLATATINILGSGFGLPSAQISRTLKGAQALDEGKTDNPAALLFGYDGKK